MSKLIKELEGNKDIEILLNEFKADVVYAYENSNDIEEYIIDSYRDTIFRKWLFSPVVEETYLTPYFIINNIAQDIEAGSYSIIPHIKILIEENEVTFKTKWIKYSTEESPVLEDLELLVKYCNPTIVEKEEYTYGIENGEKLIEEINFRSSYYIKYLVELAVRLDIIEEIKAIGCRCYKISNGYEKFESLDKQERIEDIIKKSIKLSNDKLSEGCNIKKYNIATEVLDNGITRENYSKYMTEIIKHYEVMTDVISNEYMEDEDREAFDEMQDILGDNMSYLLAEGEFGTLFDINFTNVFSYYLGISNCIYMDMFFVDIFNKVTEMLIRKESGINAIFTLEGGHDLTLYGEKALGYLNKSFNERMFNKATNITNKDILKFYLSTKEEKLEEYLGKLQGNIKFHTFGDQGDDMLEDIFGNGLPQVMLDHLGEFGSYLIIDRKLKEKTATKHCENAEFYIRNFMNMENLLDINRITIDSINTFLVDWYIPKVATSKTNVKEVITSLNQYLKFLFLKGLISKEILDGFKKITNNKENYLEYFEQCMEDEWDNMW